MSREIKFRAWNKAKKFMDTAWLVDWEHGQVAHKTHNVSQLENCILMQYTGLKDKNGKEIYEGDIITGKGIQGVIKWIPEHCGFLIHEEMGYTFIDAGNVPATSYEVIGNIYEHPELLEATS